MWRHKKVEELVDSTIKKQQSIVDTEIKIVIKHIGKIMNDNICIAVKFEVVVMICIGKLCTI